MTLRKLAEMLVAESSTDSPGSERTQIAIELTIKHLLDDAVRRVDGSLCVEILVDDA